MICRYCGTAYAPEDRLCEGCGGPKGPAVQTLLDRSSGAMRWLADYRHALHLALGGTAAVVVLNALLAPGSGLDDNPLILLSVLWIAAGVPSILCPASIVSAKGRPWTIATNLLLSVLVWFGLAVAMVIGLSIVY